MIQLSILCLTSKPKEIFRDIYFHSIKQSRNVPGSQISDVLLLDQDEAALDQQLREGELRQQLGGVHGEGGEQPEAHRAHVHQQDRL